MINRGKVLKKQRVFSEEFKKLRVKEFEKGEFSVLELSKLYGVVHQTVYTWIYKYSTYNKKGLRIVEMKSSSKTKVKELHDRIKELERVVGQTVPLNWLPPGSLLPCPCQDVPTGVAAMWYW